MNKLIDTFKQTANHIAFLNRGKGLESPDLQSAVEEAYTKAKQVRESGHAEYLHSIGVGSFNRLITKSWTYNLRGMVHLIAHRGRFEGPENTIIAMTQLPPGCKGVEIDVRFTSDGIPILLHDSTVDRTTDGSGPIAQMTLAEAKELDAGSWFDPWFSGTRIPTLEEYLRACKLRNISFVVLDVKVCDTQEQAQAICDAIENSGMSERTFFVGNNIGQISTLRSVNTEIRAGLLNATTSNIDSYLQAISDYNLELVFLAGGGYEEHKSIAPLIKKSGALVGGSVVNESADIDRWLIENYMEVVMTDQAGFLERLLEVEHYG